MDYYKKYKKYKRLYLKKSAGSSNIPSEEEKKQGMKSPENIMSLDPNRCRREQTTCRCIYRKRDSKNPENVLQGDVEICDREKEDCDDKYCKRLESEGGPRPAWWTYHEVEFHKAQRPPQQHHPPPRRAVVPGTTHIDASDSDSDSYSSGSDMDTSELSNQPIPW